MANKILSGMETGDLAEWGASTSGAIKAPRRLKLKGPAFSHDHACMCEAAKCERCSELITWVGTCLHSAS